MKPKAIIILVLVTLFIIVLIQNTQVVTLRLLFWKVEMSQIVLIPLVLFVGMVVGYLLGTIRKKAARNQP